MISTDKAVNPTNIRAARAAGRDLRLQFAGPASSRGGAKGKTRFRHHPFRKRGWAQRIGDPALPRAEIAKGGPVTVTILKSRASS